ncbi:Dos2-interacting transcription regulator of RNA-Pol-II-domain-containing protein [Astrocystis sublimbata]|nr:Dos2-interacting transcription regulator of RNA-Pol-II-domain-containing protein [Astrocystis sublimbata]
MAAPKSEFDQLAFAYVLGDDEAKGLQIIEQAASAIEISAVKRVAIGQWVASISQWVSSSDNEDLISRAKALDFLASTLEVLSRKEDTLNADQVKLLVTFFCSLFDSDHKAGVTASTKALKQLTAMKHFQPTLGGDIIQGVCKLGDDFKLQAPPTRLEIYRLVSDLLGIPAVINDLEYRHGNTGGFMLDILNLCRNERDPENLMIWFTILRSFLQDFDPSADVTSEIFKAFSAYYPISLRPSATTPTVTTDDLKLALRSCFCAHRRAASLCIPFLVEKLDKVDMTVAVKVDILSTLDACLSNYDHPKQSVVPHADQIWGSLKYEVRNGEIPDTVKATLKVLTTLTKRLDGDDLQVFVNDAWKDLEGDISEPRYTAQAGRLLVATVGASHESFALLVPRAFEHIKRSLKNNSSLEHKRHLITLMSSIVKLRLHLVPSQDPDQSQHEDVGLLSDDLFGDSLLHDLYLPFWEDHSAASSPTEHVDLLQAAMEGLGALIGQTSSGLGPRRRLCSNSTCKTILDILAKPVIACPLKGPKFFSKSDDWVPQGLLDAGEDALSSAVLSYPPSFRHLLVQFMAAIEKAYQMEPQPDDLSTQIYNVSLALCNVCHSSSLNADASWLHEAALINTLLQCLQWMLSQKADPSFLCSIIQAIHVAVNSALEQSLKWDTSPAVLQDCMRQFEESDAPQLHHSHAGKIEALEALDIGPGRPRRIYCLFVVQQLYRRFTKVNRRYDGTYESTLLSLSEDMESEVTRLVTQQDMFLSNLGALATSVVRVFSEQEQEALGLDTAAFLMFHWKDHRNDPEPEPAEWIMQGINPANNCRMAPLTLGIMEGLWPGVMKPEVHANTINSLVGILTHVSATFSTQVGRRMGRLLCVLSNKFNASSESLVPTARSDTQNSLSQVLKDVACAHMALTNAASNVRIFSFILDYLAGDIVRPHSGRTEHALLIEVIRCCFTAFAEGRVFARALGRLVAPRDYLSKANHACVRKLGLGWFFHGAVAPYLAEEEVGPVEAMHRAVGLFSMLQHLNYNVYASQVTTITRIAIRSLSTFQVGVETLSLLTVLNAILEAEAAELLGHLKALVEGLVKMYQEALVIKYYSIPESGQQGPIDGYIGRAYESSPSDPSAMKTRLYVLQFLRKLTENKYELHHLLPLRKNLLRPLAYACADPVREIRQVAREARQAWEKLD